MQHCDFCKREVIMCNDRQWAIFYEYEHYNCDAPVCTSVLFEAEIYYPVV